MQSGFYDSFQGNNNGKSKRMRSQSFMQGNSNQTSKIRTNNQRSYYTKNYPIKQANEYYARSRYAIDDNAYKEKMNRKQKYAVRYDSEPKIKNAPNSVKKRRNSGNLNLKYDSPLDDGLNIAKQLDGFKVVQNGIVILDFAKTNAEIYEKAISDAKLHSDMFASSVLITGPKQEQISLPNFYLVQEARS